MLGRHVAREVRERPIAARADAGMDALAHSLVCALDLLARVAFVDFGAAGGGQGAFPFGEQFTKALGIRLILIDVAMSSGTEKSIMVLAATLLELSCDSK